MNRLTYIGVSILAMFLLAQPHLQAEDVLTLDQALDLALNNSNVLKIGRARVLEKNALADKIESKQFPRVLVGGFGVYNTNPVDERIHAGDFDYLLSDFGGISGPLSFLSPLPSSDIPLVQGDDWPWAVHGTVIQPLSMLPRIRTGAAAAKTEQDIAKAELASLTSSIRYDVEQCYCGIVASDAAIKAARAEIGYATSQLTHATDAVEVGEKLPLTLSGLQVELTEARSKLEKTIAGKKRLTFLLNMLIDRPIESPVAVDHTLPPEPTRLSRQEYIEIAKKDNPTIVKSGHQVRLAEHGIKSTRQANYPDIFAFGSVIHQQGMPLIQEDFGLFGIGASWKLFDFGETDADNLVNRQKKIQALEMLAKSQREVQMDIVTQLSELDHAEAVIKLAENAREFRRKEVRLATDRVQVKLELDTRELKARADLAKAEAELVAALVKRRLILRRLEQLAGIDARFESHTSN